MIGNHIIRASHPSGFSNILLLRVKEFRISNSTVTFPACDQSAFIRLVRILHIIDHTADGIAETIESSIQSSPIILLIKLLGE